MKSFPVGRYFVVLVIFCSALRAAVGEVSPLTSSDLTKVQSILAKNVKGSPTIKSGQKEELDGGWKITCIAKVGDGGEFLFVLNAEKSMTLGTVVAQNPSPKG